MKPYAALARSYRGAFSSLPSSIVAAWQGRRAGPQRLDIDEVADTAYLAHLRCGAELDLIAISADLDRDLGAVTDFEDHNPTLRCGENVAPVQQADALALVRIAECELVCVAPSRARRRNDRDRRPPLDAGWR